VKSVLVVGHKGMLAHDLLELLAPLADQGDLVVHVGDLPEIDITNPDGTMKYVKDRSPNVIINCAAYTDVDGCESHRDLAFAVNGAGPGNLARAANAVDAKLVHISTDFVFDGRKDGAYREEDETAPLSAYGLSKLEGERQVELLSRDHVIVRTAWLFGVAGKCFPKAILRQVEAGKPLRVVDDQRGSPTHTLDLAEALWALVEADARGIYHGAGAGTCTWFEFAEEICRQAGRRVEIEPIDSSQLNRPATRPANSVLDSSRLTEKTGFAFPSWRQGLRVFMERLGV
jgi:dTDP-4-dehydrorhamnose reductase